MKVNIGDLILLGNNNGHPTKAGIVTSIGTIGACPDGVLKGQDYVFLNDEETPWMVWEIQEQLFAHIEVDTIKTFNTNH